jgi:hypothetical protein
VSSEALNLAARSSTLGERDDSGYIDDVEYEEEEEEEKEDSRTAERDRGLDPSLVLLPVSVSFLVEKTMSCNAADLTAIVADSSR